jgi:asparagine synthase (glutamine-hydrolysing)
MDRFGALPLYWTATAAGCAFACGVRGVLMAPGIDAAPDTDALREAVTFGGFRLGDRTNVRGVRMLPGAGALKACGHNAAVSRYWDWGRVESRPAVSVDDAGRECHARWRTAIGRRLAGAARPGQTLSGGLDSRAILAEAAPRAPRWTAITYGVPGCEDATYAAKAAKAAGRVDWRLLPLYEGDWLSTRDAHIQSTDGLVQLGDLMHLECLPLQRALIDVHLSGYIGDAVAGQTFADVQRIDDAAVAMPYYETAIGLGWPAALDHLRSATADPAWLTSRFALFEHKLPQSTSRWSHAWRAWGLRVRRPFTDYAFFDWCQSLPADLRGPKRVYERWLRAAYPALFARIPNHKTGAPVLASRMQLAQARGGRAVRRSWIATARRLGLPHTPWSRAFHDDVGRWRQADVRQRIEHAVLAGDGTAMSLWPARDLAALVGAWFDRGEGPTQVIGALYVFERYQRDLPAHLRRARELAAGVNWSLPAASC